MVGTDEGNPLSVKNENMMKKFNSNHVSYTKINDIQNLMKPNNFVTYNNKERESMFNPYPLSGAKNLALKKGYMMQVIYIMFLSYLLFHIIVLF